MDKKTLQSIRERLEKDEEFRTQFIADVKGIFKNYGIDIDELEEPGIKMDQINPKPMVDTIIWDSQRKWIFVNR